MLAPEKLLRVKPLQAIKEMLSERWPGSKPEWFVIKSMRGSRASDDFIVTVRLSNLYVPLDIRHRHHVDFEYTFTKLDISMLNYKGPIVLPISSIKTTPPLIDLLGDYFLPYGGFKFDETDFEGIHDPVIPGTKTLETDLGSYRWSGTLDVDIVVVNEPIGKYLLRTDCVLDHTVIFSVSSLQLMLTNALNEINIGLLPLPLYPEWVVLDTESIESVGNESDQLNTKINISLDSYGSPYEGNVTITYGRKSFYMTYNRPVVIAANVTSNASVLELINTKCGAAVDLVEIEWPVTRPSGRHPLPIVSSSIAHVGHIWVIYE